MPKQRSSNTAPLNARTSIVLVLVVAFSAVPFGSNRPFFWCLWSGVVCAAAFVYLASVYRARLDMRVPLRSLGLPGLLFAGVGLFIVIQFIPLGPLGPAIFAAPSGIALASDTLSLTPGDTRFALLRWVTYGLLFFLMLQTAVRVERARRIASALVVVVGCEAAYALAALVPLGDTILFFDKAYYRGVATGTFINRNSLATFLGIGIVLAVALVMPVKHDVDTGQVPRQGILVPLLALLAMIAALLATQSRMGLFSTIAGAATVLFFRGPASRFGLWGILIGLSTVSLLAVLYGAGVLERLIFIERAAETRFELYRQVLGMIAERPLSGYGAGSFKLAYPLFHAPSVSVAVTWDYAHSTYLALWTGLGVVAGTLPVLTIGLIVVAMMKGRRPGEMLRAETCAAIGATVTVGLHSLVDFSLEMQGVAMLYTAVLALGSAKAFYLRANEGGYRLEVRA